MTPTEPPRRDRKVARTSSLLNPDRKGRDAQLTALNPDRKGGDDPR